MLQIDAQQVAQADSAECHAACGERRQAARHPAATPLSHTVSPWGTSMTRTWNRQALLMAVFALACLVLAAVAGPTGPAQVQSMSPGGIRMLSDTSGRKERPGYECMVEKGKASGGLKVFCAIDSDTLVVGQPAVVRLGLVNVGNDAARVLDRFDGLTTGIPMLYVADPAGYEYRYKAEISSLIDFPCRNAVILQPGDTLAAVFQVTLYRGNELLFPLPGRWGLYFEYYMLEDRCHRAADAASEIAWVEVIDRDSSDTRLWALLTNGGQALPYRAPTAVLRDIVNEYPHSRYRACSLYMYAGRLEASHDYDQAIEYFRRYRLEYPQSFLAGESLFAVARCLHELGRFDDAVQAFRYAQAMDKWNWKSDERYRAMYVAGGRRMY